MTSPLSRWLHFFRNGIRTGEIVLRSGESNRRAFLTNTIRLTAGVAGLTVAGSALTAQADVTIQGNQGNWRFCTKCYGLFFYGYPTDGVCPAGGAHGMAGYNFILPHDVSETSTAQGNWRFCTKCFGMFFRGYPSDGRCPAGAGHDAAGYNFVLPHDVPATPTAQGNWRFCTKCFGMFFYGYPTNGVCAAGGAHGMAGYNFVLPHS
ncbi:hypothetical protein ACIA8G_34875 [Lentzea sp. NPDC051213]|uniref:hypothetical protein n=1 Tax=Lentzea sp. NPDC051213 TaxID=3364126 RepID=UPI003793F611